MTSAFSWQKSVNLCPASFCTPRSNLPIIPGISWLPTFAFQSPMMQRISFFFFFGVISRRIKPVSPKGNQSWIFIGGTDADAEASILWPPDAKNWLTGKDPDAGQDWRQEEKGMTEDEIVGWLAGWMDHWLYGHEFEQAPGVSDGQGSLVCCSSWSDMTEQLNWLNWLEGLEGLRRTVQLQHLWHLWLGHRLGLLCYWMVCLGNEQSSEKQKNQRAYFFRFLQGEK